MYFTPASSLYINDIKGGQEKELVKVGNKEDIPRFIWSNDGRYIFYNLVDYSTMAEDREALESSVQVGVWKVDVNTGAKTLLYNGKATHWNVFDFYILGYDPNLHQIIVSYQSVTKPPFTGYNWEIGLVKTEVEKSGFDVKSNFNIFTSIKGSIEEFIGVAPYLLDNNKIAYILTTSDKKGEISYDDFSQVVFGLLSLQDKSQTIIDSFSYRNGPSIGFSPLNTKYLYYEKVGKQNGKDVTGDVVLDDNGSKSNIPLLKKDEKESKFVSLSPDTNYRLANFRGKTDPRGLQEWGLQINEPTSEKTTVITDENATFVDWI